jgi:hypothetical protein
MLILTEEANEGRRGVKWVKTVNELNGGLDFNAKTRSPKNAT